MKKAHQMANHPKRIHLIYNNNFFRNKVKKHTKWHTIQSKFTRYITIISLPIKHISKPNGIPPPKENSLIL